VERFLVVSGHGLIQLRKEGLDESGQPYPVLSYEVSGKQLEVVEMIAGYTHNLITSLILRIWLLSFGQTVVSILTVLILILIL